jgi:pimeloyl-ACP methyl ester carboxylesterase
MPTIEVNGIDLTYQVRGAGEPVLLITGAGARATLWQSQARGLTAAGYQVITYDHRGTFPDPVGKPYGLAELVDDAVRLIDVLELAPCRVVGFSLGATVAQHIAANHPDMVRSLVLIATSACAGVLRTTLLRGMADYLRGDVRIAPRYQAAMTATQMFAPATLRNERMIADWLDLFTYAPAESRQLAGQYEAAVGDQRAALADVVAPCLVIGFEHDLVTPVAECRQVSALIRGSRFTVVPGCGHLGLLERPDEITRLLFEFLATS